jgi:hypothetical protein
VSASGINPSWRRDYFIRHRICVCTPEDECRLCSGMTAADERVVLREIARAATEQNTAATHA